MVEKIFYNEWALFGESSIAKPYGTSVLRWEEIKDDLEPNLRGLLKQKRKREEAPTTESNSSPHCVMVKKLDNRIMYRL